jgi:hypothetical protein
MKEGGKEYLKEGRKDYMKEGLYEGRKDYAGRKEGRKDGRTDGRKEGRTLRAGSAWAVPMIAGEAKWSHRMNARMHV